MALVPTVTIEQAALNALGRWLTAGLSGYTVSFRWPSPEQPLVNKAVTLLRAGPRQDEYVDPALVGSELIHAKVTVAPDELSVEALGTGDPYGYVSPVPPVDLPTSLTVLAYLALSYVQHIEDATIHVAPDTMDVLTAPNATTLPTAITQAEDLRAKLNAHEPSVSHLTPDTRNSVTVPAATDLPSLLALLAALIRALGAHYVARVDVWSLRGCRLPVQLDVWATFEATRDTALALLEPLLNADPFLSAGVGYWAGNPGHNGITVALADGWSGVADFDFDSPTLMQTSASQQVSEFRASYLGYADFMLLVKAQSARLVAVTLRQQIDSAATRTVRLTPTGSTSSE